MLVRKFLEWVPLVLLLAVSACANLSSVHHEFRAGKGESGVLIDAKQRAILVQSDNGRVCAEPSPDALSAFAAALTAGASGSANSKQGDSAAAAAQGSFGTSETAAYIGLRTTSIQLLRDQGYRLCESYLNKAIDSDAYALAMRRHQRDVVAMMAIEELMQSLGSTGRTAQASPSVLPTTVAGVTGPPDAMNRAVTDPAHPAAPQAPAAKAALPSGPAAGADASSALPGALPAAAAAGAGAGGAGAAGAPQPASATPAPAVQPVSPAIAILPVPGATPSSGLDVSVQQGIVAVVGTLAKGLVYADDLAPLCFDYLKKNGTSAKAAENPLIGICTTALQKKAEHGGQPNSQGAMDRAAGDQGKVGATNAASMARLAIPELPVPVMAVPPPPAMLKLRLATDVAFASGSAELSAEAKVKLTEFARNVQPNLPGNAKVKVTGYADSAGSPAAGQTLSLRRAEAVKNFLLAVGFPSSSITVEGKGLAEPIAGNNTASGRAKSRRVEVRLDGGF